MVAPFPKPALNTSLKSALCLFLLLWESQKSSTWPHPPAELISPLAFSQTLCRSASRGEAKFWKDRKWQNLRVALVLALKADYKLGELCLKFLNLGAEQRCWSTVSSPESSSFMWKWSFGGLESEHCGRNTQMPLIENHRNFHYKNKTQMWITFPHVYRVVIFIVPHYLRHREITCGHNDL